LFGGEDSSSVANIPSDITLTNSTLTKNLAWLGKGYNVKNALELKSCKRVTVANCILERSWNDAQTGFLVVLTVRNQSGTAPWSTIEDVEMHHNIIRDGCAAFQILAADDRPAPFTSQRMKRVNIHDNTITAIDPWPSSGDDRLILILDGPEDLSIVNNTFAGQHVGSVVYLDGPTRCKNLTITGNRFPLSSYQVFGTEDQQANLGVNQPQALFDHFAPGGVLSGNSEA
jgi:hypothetical protein